MLKRLSTTKALLFLSHRTFRLDRLVPGFRRSMTCGGRGRMKEEVSARPSKKTDCFRDIEWAAYNEEAALGAAA